MDIELVIKIVGSAAGSIAAIWGLIIKIVKPMYKSYKLRKQKKLEQKKMEAKQYSNLIEALGKLSYDVRQVKDKVFPNGGSSIFDGITRLERGMLELNTKVDSLEDTQKISLNMQKVAFWISEKEGLFNYVSPALCRLLHRTESELLNNNWISCLIKTDTDRISQAWVDAIEEKRTFDEVYAFIDGNNPGRVITVHGLAFHKIDKITGKYIGSYGTITESII